MAAAALKTSAAAAIGTAACAVGYATVIERNAFVVRERDHVTFDILYLAAPRRVRAVFALISAGAIVAALGASFWPTWDWIEKNCSNRYISAMARKPTVVAAPSMPAPR